MKEYLCLSALTDQKVVYQTPSQVLDLAIQIVSFETQGSLERDLNSIAANLFPDFNQIGGEVIAIDKNLSVHFETTSEQVLTITWDTDNTTSSEDVVESSQASFLQNTASTSTSGGDCGKREKILLRELFHFPKIRIHFHNPSFTS